MKFALLETGSGPYWFRIENDRFVNQVGGMISSKLEDILECCEADSWEELNWNKTFLDARGENLRTGWLSPEAEFTPCRTRDHDDTAILLLKKSVGELEADGWIRIVLGDWRNGESEQLLCDHISRKQTRKQIKWLRDHGYDEYQIGGLEELIFNPLPDHF